MFNIRIPTNNYLKKKEYSNCLLWLMMPSSSQVLCQFIQLIRQNKLYAWDIVSQTHGDESFLKQIICMGHSQPNSWGRIIFKTNYMHGT